MLENDDSLMGRRVVPAARGCLPHRPHADHPVASEGHRALDHGHLSAGIPGGPLADRQLCDANYTVVAKVPKQFLPKDIPWMNGVHQ